MMSEIEQENCEKYYNTVNEYLTHLNDIKVYPVMGGTYVWEHEKDMCILYEITNQMKYTRCAFHNNRLLSTKELQDICSNVTSPKPCDVSSLIKALMKLDSITEDGMCLIEHSNTIEFIYSFKCLMSYDLYQSLLCEHNISNYDICNEELQYNVIKDIQHQNVQMKYALLKHMLYHIQTLKFNTII